MNVQTTLPDKAYQALVTEHFSTVGDVEVLHQIEARLQSVKMPFVTTAFNQDRFHRARLTVGKWRLRVLQCPFPG